MSYSKFHPSKNDFAFALLMSAVFASIVGAVAGTLQLLAGPIELNPANTEETAIALRASADTVPPFAPSGARK